MNMKEGLQVTHFSLKLLQKQPQVVQEIYSQPFVSLSDHLSSWRQQVEPPT
jgi:hypothetical protein